MLGPYNPQEISNQNLLVPNLLIIDHWNMSCAKPLNNRQAAAKSYTHIIDTPIRLLGNAFGAAFNSAQAISIGKYIVLWHS